MTLGATNQGMVAGDLVNTASRLQSAAAPGTVLVGEATQRAAVRAIAFEAAGEQGLKGKAAPVPAWRALRVVAEVGGRGRERHPRGAVRGPRRRAAAAQGPVPRDDAASGGRGWSRSSARRASARPAWPGSSSSTSTAWSSTVWWHEGRSPGLRRGHQLLGARRDGARALRPARDRRRGDDPRARWPRRSPSTSRSRGAALDRACAAGPAGHRDAAGSDAAVRRLAHVLRAAGGDRAGGDGLRGPPLRGHRARSTSSTTSWSGAAGCPSTW